MLAAIPAARGGTTGVGTELVWTEECVRLSKVIKKGLLFKEKRLKPYAIEFGYSNRVRCTQVAVCCAIERLPMVVNMTTLVRLQHASMLGN